MATVTVLTLILTSGCGTVHNLTHTAKEFPERATSVMIEEESSTLAIALRTDRAEERLVLYQFPSFEETEHSRVSSQFRQWPELLSVGSKRHSLHWIASDLRICGPFFDDLPVSPTGWKPARFIILNNTREEPPTLQPGETLVLAFRDLGNRCLIILQSQPEKGKVIGETVTLLSTPVPYVHSVPERLWRIPESLVGDALTPVLLPIAIIVIYTFWILAVD